MFSRVLTRRTMSYDCINNLRHVTAGMVSGGTDERRLFVHRRKIKFVTSESRSSSGAEPLHAIASWRGQPLKIGGGRGGGHRTNKLFRHRHGNRIRRRRIRVIPRSSNQKSLFPLPPPLPRRRRRRRCNSVAITRRPIRVKRLPRRLGQDYGLRGVCGCNTFSGHTTLSACFTAATLPAEGCAP